MCRILMLTLILLCNVGFLLLSDILCFIKRTEVIDQIGLVTSIFAVVFTQPMFPILVVLFLKSCQDMQNLCNQAQGQDVSYRDTLHNAQPETERLLSTEVHNYQTIEDVNSNENVRSRIEEATFTVELDSLNEVQVNFANLTKAWSPMLFTVFSCECIMLINACLVISKVNTDADKIDLMLWGYLLLQSGLTIIFVCNVTEWTHNRIQDYSHAARYVF